MNDVDPKLRDEVREIFEHTRKDAITFALLTVVLTPFFLAGAAAALFFGLAVMVGDGFAFDSAYGTLWLVTLFLVLTLWTVWSSGSERPWLGAAMVAGAAFTVGIGPMLMLPPRVHLGIFGGLAFGALAVMGRSYQPRDSYYVGGRHGDVFTFRDEADRFHIAAGCLMAIPTLMLGAFGEIFASSWLWHRVEEEWVSAGARVLLGAKQRNAEEVIRTLGYERLRVLDLLRRSQLARVHRDKVTLTEKGHQLLA